MGIVGHHIRINTYPNDSITEPVVTFEWEAIYGITGVETRYYISPLSSSFGSYSSVMSYTKILPPLGDKKEQHYVFHIQSKNSDGETDQLDIPFTLKKVDEDLVPIVDGFPRQHERTKVISEPISQIRPAVFRGPTDSHSYNLSSQEFYYDMSQLFHGAQQLESILEQSKKIFEQQRKTFSAVKTDLETRITELEGLLNSNKNHRKTLSPSTFIPGYPTVFQGVKPDALSSFVDKDFGTISPAHSSMPSSKTYLYDDIKNRIFVEDLKIEVQGGEGYTKETPRIHAVDGCRNTYWMYEAHYPSSSGVTEEIVDFIVEIPKDIVSNSLVNYISLIPYPEGGIDLLDLQYQGADGVFKTVPSFVQKFSTLHKEYTSEPIEHAFRKAFTFPPTEVQKIKVKLRQRNFSTIEGRKVFTLGIQDLGIYFVDYTHSPSVFYTEIDINLPVGQANYQVQDIKPIFNYLPSGNENYRQWIKTELYRKTAGNLTEVNLNTNMTDKKLVLVGYLYPSNGFVPVLNGIELRYKSE